MIDFKDTEYLKRGNPRQKGVYRIISELGILSVLREYRPVVAGTIPLDIDVETSDIDVLCHVTEFDPFERILEKSFARCDKFQLKKSNRKDAGRVTAGFFHGGEKVQIFGQPVPVEKQNGYMHMVVEYRILGLTAESFRAEIRRLKEEGVKTEPAFAALLEIDENPYDALLHYFRLSDEQLRAVIPLRWHGQRHG